MIRQSGLSPAGIVIDPPHVIIPSTEPKCQWRGLEVLKVFQSGVGAFFRSPNPYYDPPNSQTSAPDVAGSAEGIEFTGSDGKTSNCLQITTLAGRAIAAYANLSPEISNALGYLANLVSAGRLASDQFNGFTTRAGMVPEPGMHRQNAPDETPGNTKDKTGKASQPPQQQPDKSTAATLRGSQLPNTSLALGALVGLSAVGPSSASDPDTTPWIRVPDAETLGKICHDAKYPCDKKYRLTADIDGSRLPQSIGVKNRPFTGQLDGQGHRIGNLSHCLVGKLYGEGGIDRIRFIDANITSTAPAGVAVCAMSGNAMVSNIQVERAQLVTEGFKAHAAIISGRMNGGTVTNTTATNCMVKTSGNDSYASIGAGYLADGGAVTNTTAVNCHVETEGKSASAGIGVGYKFFKGTVVGTTAVNCTVETSGPEAKAGIGAGYQVHENPPQNKGTIAGTTAVNCKVKTSGRFASAGIGAGYSWGGTVSDTTAVNCAVATSADGGFAGIGAGSIDNEGTVTGTTAVNCTVTTSGINAHAGIGAGLSISGNVAKTTVINSTIKSNGIAGINGGVNTIFCNININGEQKTGSLCDCRYVLDNALCVDIDPRLVTPNCQVSYDPDVLCGTNAPPTPPITKTLATVPSTNTTFSSPGLVTTTTPPTTVATVPGTTFSSPGSATFTTPTQPAASLVTYVIIALGTVFVLLAGAGISMCAHRYRQRSSTKTGRNLPLPEHFDSEPWTDRSLSANLDHYYELLSDKQQNTAPGARIPMVDTAIELEQQPLGGDPIYENLPIQPAPLPLRTYNGQ